MLDYNIRDIATYCNQHLKWSDHYQTWRKVLYDDMKDICEVSGDMIGCISAVVDYSFCRWYPIKSHGCAVRIPITNQDIHRNWFIIIKIIIVMGKYSIDQDNRTTTTDRCYELGKHQLALFIAQDLYVITESRGDINSVRHHGQEQ